MTKFDDLYARFGVPALEHQFGETVTYRARRTNDSGDAWEYELYTITARRREQQISEQSLGAAVTSAAPMLWNVAASVFTEENLDPRIGDAIIDEDNNLWTITAFKKTGLTKDYEFTTQYGEI